MSQILYKYLDVVGAKMMLCYRNLQFTNATKFNDPFDCHPGLIEFSNIPENVSNRTWMSKDMLIQLESHRYVRNRENAWVSCLSKSFDNMLMWSYYNCHKGVCIGLNRELISKSLQNSMLGMMVMGKGYDVKYRDIIDKPDFYNHKEDLFLYQMCTKGKAWEHEQEVRFFIIKPSSMCMGVLPDQNDKEGPIDWKSVRAFPNIAGECFVSIYLGVNISEKDKAEIIQFAKNINPGIRIYQMQINSDKFKLDTYQV